MREWLEWHAPCLLGLYDWPAYRLFGRCFVCGLATIRHSRRQLDVCETTPMPIEITDRGWLVSNGLDPDAVSPAPRATA